MRNAISRWFLILTAALSSGAYSGTMSPVSHEYSKVMTVILGPDFVRQSSSQNIVFLPPVRNVYSSADNWHAVADVGGFLGAEYPLSNRFRMQTGIAGYGTTPISVAGQVRMLDEESNHSTYHYSVQSSRLMLSNKILAILNKHPRFHPYVIGELGMAINIANNYRETPALPLATAMTPFENRAKDSFSWAVGVGSEYDLSANVRVGIGYQLADLGGASLGATSIGDTSPMTTNQTLSISHLWSNQLRFQVSYLIT